MNRSEKERQKKLATMGEETAADFLRVEEQTRSWHLRLFPEEYDYTYDGGVEAKERARGINPMSQDYIDHHDHKRVALGFEPYSVAEKAGISTYAWVETLVREKRIDELEIAFAEWIEHHE